MRIQILSMIPGMCYSLEAQLTFIWNFVEDLSSNLLKYFVDPPLNFFFNFYFILGRSLMFTSFCRSRSGWKNFLYLGYNHLFWNIRKRQHPSATNFANIFYISTVWSNIYFDVHIFFFLIFVFKLSINLKFSVKNLKNIFWNCDL